MIKGENVYKDNNESEFIERFIKSKWILQKKINLIEKIEFKKFKFWKKKINNWMQSSINSMKIDKRVQWFFYSLIQLLHHN